MSSNWTGVSSSPEALRKTNVSLLRASPLPTCSDLFLVLWRKVAFCWESHPIVVLCCDDVRFLRTPQVPGPVWAFYKNHICHLCIGSALVDRSKVRTALGLSVCRLTFMTLPAPKSIRIKTYDLRVVLLLRTGKQTAEDSWSIKSYLKGMNC